MRSCLLVEGRSLVGGPAGAVGGLACSRCAAIRIRIAGAKPAAKNVIEQRSRSTYALLK